MTDARFIAITTMVASIAGPLINAFMARRHEQKNEVTRQKVDVLVEQTNGITAKLGAAEFARGLKQGEDNPL